MSIERSTRRYTLALMCITAGGSLLFFLPLTILSPATPLWVRIVFAAGSLVIEAWAVYAVGQRLARKMINRIDRAFRSEKAFVGNASHELNNPLTAIQGECEITLLKERSADEYKLALHRISEETSRIISLMQRLRFLSKGEGEILRSGTETVILAEFIMQHFNGDRISFSTDNFSFTLEINPELLKTALENIIGNALKYSGNKTVELRLRAYALDIADKGIGIPPNEIDRVFQPFYRAVNTREYAGNGIGLSLSIHILRAYGAEVSISSVINEGTRVRIDFKP
ncbi:MAG: HAMP domain-containing histidine kinase [Tannerellaceae bacterium]|jgi:signal transduction histidine kinase|nr:HAMP domain-containing histidine kinase [Tannerellaceae bacterium]